jgi:hypothetical protein
MSDNLTDEQLRAERAKPTKSDAERAREIDMLDDHDLFMAELVSAFASIRAEGSAELEKLEAALSKIRHYASVRFDWGMLDLIDAAVRQPAESGATGQWPPADCQKKSSCDRNGACMYVPCVHAGQQRAGAKP